jgi:hypothetical protein
MKLYSSSEFGWGLGVEINPGEMFYPPHAAQCGLYVNHNTGEHEKIDLGIAEHVPYKFNCCLRAKNGLIYLLPLNYDKMLILDWDKREVSTIPLIDDLLKNHRVYDAVLSTDGRYIIGTPYDTGEMFIFDTETNDHTFYNVLAEPTETPFSKAPNITMEFNYLWGTINVDHSTGKLYCIPAQGAVTRGQAILELELTDLTNITIKHIPIPQVCLQQVTWGWHGVDVLDGQLYMAPNNDGNMLIYDITQGTFTAIPIPIANNSRPTARDIALANKHGRFFDVVVANEKVYLLPRNTDGIGVYMPKEQRYKVIGQELEYAPVDNYLGGILGSDGNIYLGPNENPCALKINTDTDIIDTIRVSIT